MKIPRGTFAFITLALVGLLALPVAAADKEPCFSIYAGSGHIWTGSGGYGYSLDKAEWQLQAGAEWRVSKRISIGLGIARDTATVSEWFIEHNFDVRKPPEAYNYTATDLYGKFVINPGDKAEVFALAGGTWFKSGDLAKGGYLAGVGLQYNFGKAFVQTTLKYRHVDQFLVPVANVVETGIGVGFRF